MSHHFDTQLAKEDPRLNVCDFYLFQGAPETTVMAMTVNPDVVLSAPDTLHVEGLYAFRLDLTGDAREDVVFKFRFDEPRHVNGDEHLHVQKFQVRRATGEAIGGDKGELLIEGDTGKVHSKSGIRAFVGIVPDMFAADAAAMRNLQNAFYNEHRYDGDAFLRQPQNFFNHRNITAIVLEVPNHLIGKGTVHAWATVSLYGHAPEMQVSRWGLPMITHLFLNDPGNQEVKETFNKSAPSDDIALFSGYIADYTRKMVTYAASVKNPEEYGKQIVSRLCPSTLPYELGTAAAFDLAGFNGRPLGDDVQDVMLTLATSRPLQDGVAPDRNRIRAEFPYFGEPYSKEEQKDVVPLHPPRSVTNVGMKLEVVVIPVSNADRAKEFYSRLGWRLDADRVAGDNFRLIQFTPPGSGSSIQFGVNLTSAAPGSAQAFLLVVSDIVAARQQLVERGIDASEVFHCASGTGCRFPGIDVRVSGPHPERLSYGSFVSFKDPDGNGWLLQEVTQRLPGRV